VPVNWEQLDQELSGQKSAQPLEQGVADVPSAPQNTFMDGVEAFNRSFANMAEGTLKGFASLTGMSSFEKRIDAVHQQGEQSLAEAKDRSPYATLAGGVAGDVASSVAYGALGGAIGKGVAAASPAIAGVAADISAGAAASVPGVVRGAAGLAGASAGLSYLNYADTNDERLANAERSAAIGAGLYGAGALVGTAVKSILPKEGVSGFMSKVFDPKGSAAKDMAHRVGVDEIAAGQPGMLSQAAQAAERQGVPLTPGQLMQHNFLKGGGDTRSAEKVMRIAEADKPLIAAVSNEQLSKISGGVKKSLDDMVPGGVDNAVATKNQLYAELDKEVFMSPLDKGKSAGMMAASNPVVDTIKNNKILSSQLDDINTSTLSKLPDNSFIKVDALKKSLDEKLWNDSNPFIDPVKKMMPYERSDLLSAREELMSSLKGFESNPKYTQARQISQQLTVQEKYLDVLNKKAGDQNIENMYSALFNSELKRSTFLKDVEATGGNVADVKDFIELAGQVSKSPLLKKIAEQATDSPEVMLQGRASGMVQNWISKNFLNRYDQAYLKLTLGGEATRDTIKQVLAPKSQDGKIKAYMKVLGEESLKGSTRAASSEAGQSGWLK
jgi:hypothetical protein